jgi:hypothetical protein
MRMRTRRPALFNLVQLEVSCKDARDGTCTFTACSIRSFSGRDEETGNISDDDRWSQDFSGFALFL